MKKEETIDLIKGEFAPDEAAEILFSIITDKIKFNNRQLLSGELRNIRDLDRYKKRLAELRVSEEIISKLIKEAKTKSKVLEINAVINIVID